MELAVATPTHRALRREMERAEEYEEWLARGRELDASRGATAWQDDLRSARYSWAFVQSLIASAPGGWVSEEGAVGIPPSELPASQF